MAWLRDARMDAMLAELKASSWQGILFQEAIDAAATKSAKSDAA